MPLIYRFRKVTDYSIRELMDDEIWGSTSEFLNDPFEGKVAYDFDVIKNKLGIDSCVQDFTKTLMITKNITKNIEQMNYIASFTRNDFKNELMWAHYADQARGFALAYEEDNLKKINNITIKDINYIYYIKDRTDEILDIIINYRKNEQLKIPQCLANEVNLSKSDSWHYENEIRILLKRDGPENHIKMCNSKPVAIYIGKNCSDKDKYILYSIAYIKEIDLYQVEYTLKNNQYVLNSRKIVRNEIEDSLNTFCFRKEILFLKKLLKKHGNKKLSDI